MLRYGLAALLLGGAAFVAGDTSMSAADAPATFTKDVLPILQKNCQTCHRPGQIGPMSLLTYQDARPWARSIKAKVESRQMPPWFADPQHGQFANDRSLPQADIDTIVKWADNGAQQGDPKDAPPAIEWPDDGWQIKPDIIVRGPEFRVPARTPQDVIEWVTFLIPSGFTKDTWITSLEIKPSVMSVTHHICFTFQPHRPDVKYYTANWVESQRDDEGAALKDQVLPARPQAPPPGDGASPPGSAAGGGFNCYVPGREADDYRKFGAGKLVPANTDISIQVHYTPIGKEVVDRPAHRLHGVGHRPGETLDVVRHHGGRAEFRHSAERSQLQEPTDGSGIPGRRRTRRDDAAHASARKGHDISTDLSGWA